MHENRTYYELPDANDLIPILEALFADLARIQGKVNLLNARSLALGIDLHLDTVSKENLSGNPVRRQLQEKMISLSEEYADVLEEIESRGVIVDDLDLGIVNFYSLHNGEEIFLSWQYGEPEVGHWHGVTENSIARRSLKHLNIKAPSAAAIH